MHKILNHKFSFPPLIYCWSINVEPSACVLYKTILRARKGRKVTAGQILYLFKKTKNKHSCTLESRKLWKLCFVCVCVQMLSPLKSFQWPYLEVSPWNICLLIFQSLKLQGWCLHCIASIFPPPSFALPFGMEFVKTSILYLRL